MIRKIVDYAVFALLFLDALITEIRARLGLIKCDTLYRECMFWLGVEEACSDYVARSRCRT